MRKVKEQQRILGSLDICKIKIDLRSRDEMPKILLGLQYIYCTDEVREEIFQILEELIPSNIDKNNGRPGMDLWKIMVFGCVRLNDNCDYDKLHDLANNHRTLREMLGHGLFDDSFYYSLQTLKDNVSLFTPEILDKINQVVVKSGHRLIYRSKKNEEICLKGRCDSFVVETDVHFPTDTNLLLDGLRKVITLISRLCQQNRINGWRKSHYNLKTIKGLYRKIQKLCRSRAKDEGRKILREEEIKQAHMNYIEIAEGFLERATESLFKLTSLELSDSVNITMELRSDIVSEINRYMSHAYRQIDQIRRRIYWGERIPHEEKVFSLFEEHTEWISKGKAGVPQELGLRVCILEDQHHFILQHHVMEKELDEMVAVKMVRETQNKYSHMVSCSFDKGFYTPENKEELKKLLEMPILPKKGKLTQADKEEWGREEIVKCKCRHSGVESAINALENHGLDRCLDHGIVGFKRYVGLAILSRNIHILGTILHKQKMKVQKRLDRLKNKEQLYSELQAA